MSERRQRRMAQGMRAVLRMWCCKRGDVLMEYVIITVLVLLPIVGASTGFFNPTGRTFTVDETLAGDNYGVFGNAVVEEWRRIMCGLSLPVP